MSQPPSLPDFGNGQQPEGSPFAPGPYPGTPSSPGPVSPGQGGTGGHSGAYGQGGTYGYGEAARPRPTYGAPGTPGMPGSGPQFGASPEAQMPPVGNGGGAQTCRRHPDRVSFVRCQRCQQPVCIDCHRPAAVGVQCPDCVSAAPQTLPRTIFGSLLTPGKPLVTIVLLGIMGAVFLLQSVGFGNFLLQYGAFSPAFALEEPWTFLTAAFLHGGIAHILFNGYALWILGNSLEPVMGRWRFLALFLASVVVGNATFMLLSDPIEGTSWLRSAVGASGGVFGLFGAMFVVAYRTRQDVQSIMLLLGINLAIPLFIPGIAWEAHLGGLAAGALITWLLIKTRVVAKPGSDRRAAVVKTNVLHALLLVVIPAVMLLVVLGRSIALGIF
ncbi:rhomboid family intramembrane serine protease [Dermabacteraceae bacterium P7074]